MLIVSLFYTLLQSPAVQTRLVRYFTEQIEKDTGVKMTIGSVNFSPFKSLYLRDVYLEDYRQDTLFYCRNLIMAIDSVHFSSRRFSVKDITLDRAYFNLWIVRGEEESKMNIDIFLEDLQKNKTEKKEEEKASKTLDISLKNIYIRNSRLIYKENEYEAVSYGINWTDVECWNVNADISHPDFSGDVITAEVSNLSLVEKSGFILDELAGNMQVQDSNLVISRIKIRTERSLLNLDTLEFNWNPGQREWKYFTEKIQQYYRLNDSYVSFIDLAYFNENLRGIENTVWGRGVVSNTVSRIQGDELFLRFGENSHVKASFKSYGLPDFWSTIFQIDIEQGKIFPNDLETIYLPWLDKNIKVPEPLHKWEYFEVDGKFNGIIEDFILDIESSTSGFQGKATLAYTPDLSDEENTLISGNFNFTGLHVGRLSRLDNIGYGYVGGKYKGKLGDTVDNFDVDAKIYSLMVNKKPIKNIDLLFSSQDETIELQSFIQDDSIRGNLHLKYEEESSIYFLTAQGDIEIDNLQRYGLAFTGQKESLKGNFDIFKTRDKVGRGHSFYTLFDIGYNTLQDSFRMDKITIQTQIENNIYNSVFVSDVAEATVKTYKPYLNPLLLTGDLLKEYFPAIVGKRNKKTLTYQDGWEYNVEIKDINPLLQIVYPELYIAPDSKLYASLESTDKNLKVNFVSDTMRYKDFIFNVLDFQTTSNKNKLEILATADRFEFKNWGRLYNVRNDIDIVENKVSNQMSWGNWQQQTYSGKLSADIDFKPLTNKTYQTEIQVYPSSIIIADSVWNITHSFITLAQKKINIKDFSISNIDQSLYVDGRLTEQVEDSLSIKLNNIDLSGLNRIMGENSTGFFGIMNGSVTVKDIYNAPLLYSDIAVENWGIGQDTLGDLQLTSYWDADSNRIAILADNQMEDKTPLQIAGYYLPRDESLDISVILDNLGLEKFEKYVSEHLGESTGILSGKIDITGSVLQPDITGYLALDSISMKMADLNTDFYIHDTIYLQNSNVYLKDFVIQDASGNRAIMQGNYNLWEDKYDLSLSLQNFLLMNTNYLHNESLYGRVWMSGLLSMNNSNDIMNINITARPVNNSEIFLPLTSVSSETGEHFLHFINSGDNLFHRRHIQQTDRKPIVLNANLEIKDNLQVQIVFDPTIGDVLKTSGEGDLRIELDQDRSINMFGEYKLSRGSYVFTLGGLFDKNFNLKQGGSIMWNGSPYEAVIDLAAVYNLKTSLSELLDDNTSALDRDRSTKVPVECILNLSDNITNPSVRFDIDFPSLDSQTKSYIQSIFSSQDEINKQMFSLLILNKFYKPDYMNTIDSEERNVGYQAGVTTASEMVSNQLSRWLSKINNNFDIDFSYRPGDNMTADEVALALSTHILNDRITLSANGNMDVGNTKNLSTNSSNNIAGDFDVEVKLNPQGTLKLKAYSHTDEKIIYKNNSETIQGVGVSYQETFDTFSELLRKYFAFLRKREKKQ